MVDLVLGVLRSGVAEETDTCALEACVTSRSGIICVVKLWTMTEDGVWSKHELRGRCLESCDHMATGVKSLLLVICMLSRYREDQISDFFTFVSWAMSKFSCKPAS